MGEVLEGLKVLADRVRTLIIQAVEQSQGEPREIVDVFWLMKDLEARVARVVEGLRRSGESP